MCYITNLKEKFKNSNGADIVAVNSEQECVTFLKARYETIHSDVKI